MNFEEKGMWAFYGFCSLLIVVATIAYVVMATK